MAIKVFKQQRSQVPIWRDRIVELLKVLGMGLTLLLALVYAIYAWLAKTSTGRICYSDLAQMFSLFPVYVS